MTQPQDSEKLTDAVIRTIRERRPVYWPARNEYAIPITQSELDAMFSELSRHRTPSVPGKDMRARAERWLTLNGLTGSNEFLEGDITSLAALLSSTAALAREEERERLSKCGTCGTPLGRQCPKCQKDWES